MDIILLGFEILLFALFVVICILCIAGGVCALKTIFDFLREEE
uniref:Uncharacterized protein n=1 Tax=Dulem virus 39 TaxID=3145757 RepID=A0AAU8B714_9CAUD